MISFINNRNKERKLLPARLKLVDVVLAGSSGAIGIYVIVHFYAECLSLEFCKGYISSSLGFWVIFPFVFIIGMFIGQAIIIGLFTFLLYLFGRLSAKEAVRYSLLFRIPYSWLNKNA